MSTEATGGVVLITGAAGGLGRALAVSFQAAGYRVAAAGHTRLPGLEGSGFMELLMEVTNRDAVHRGVGAVLERWGGVDVLVNNAGVADDGPVARMEDAAWDRVVGTSLKGAFLCSQAVLESMSRRGTGHILNVGSFAARQGTRGQANYAAAKAGLVGLTQSLAREVGSLGIRVNVVLPGVLPTRMTAGVAEDARSAWVSANALGRINDLAATARAIVALAGFADASGQVFQLDSRIARWT